MSIESLANKIDTDTQISLVIFALNSRMTIGHLLETLLSKFTALSGQQKYATPFSKLSVDEIGDLLHENGFQRHGNEMLYNGHTGEPFECLIFQGPIFYQRLKHLVAAKIHCLTGDHKVMTEQGWKFIESVSLDDKVATINQQTHVLEYHKPIALQKFNYTGKMYSVKSQQVDLNVTTNHRMFVSKRFGRQKIWKDFSLIQAEDIHNKVVKYKKNAINSNSDYQFILPAVDVNKSVLGRPAQIVNMTDWLFFYGYWIAEGWVDSTVTNGHYKITICQKKQPGASQILECAKRLGFNAKYNEKSHKIDIYSVQLYTYLKPQSVGASNKFLDNWVWQLSESQCKLLISSLIDGDGSKPASQKENETNWMYYTSSLRLADDFSKLCLHAGWSGNIKIHLKKGNQTTMADGRVITANYDMWRIGVVKYKNTPALDSKNKEDQKMYDVVNQTVYCLSVPNETFYVSRNGTPVWTGNSRSRGSCDILTRQPKEGEFLCISVSVRGSQN